MKEINKEQNNGLRAWWKSILIYNWDTPSIKVLLHLVILEILGLFENEKNYTFAI